MTQRDYVSRGRPQPKKTKSPSKNKAGPSRKNKANEPSAIPAMMWVRVVGIVLVLAGFAVFLWSIKDNAPEPDNSFTDSPKLIENEDELPELPEEEWEYIKTLPGYEVEVDVTQQAPSTKRYLLQCASFRTRAQAEELKAKIAFEGLEALIKRSTGDTGDWFRVILGPFDTKRDGERTRHTLRRANINNCKIWYWNL